MTPYDCQHNKIIIVSAALVLALLLLFFLMSGEKEEPAGEEDDIVPPANDSPKPSGPSDGRLQKLAVAELNISRCAQMSSEEKKAECMTVVSDAITYYSIADALPKGSKEDCAQIESDDLRGSCEDFFSNQNTEVIYV